MRTVAFFLSMPHAGSWDGKWSGAGKLYVVVRRVSAKQFEKLIQRNDYWYHWPDGWTARIDVQEIGSAEARQLRKKTKGFCGYDWMVESILTHGKIYADHQVPETTTA